MKKTKQPYVWGLDEYQLSRSSLRALGDSIVEVEVTLPVSPYVYPSLKIYKKLLPLNPEDRCKLQEKWSETKFKKLCKEIDIESFGILKFDNGNPYGVKISVPAKDSHKLFKLKNADMVKIRRILGRKKKRIQSKDESQFYAVKARFSFQTEGETKGLQLTEERIIAVRARTEKEAERVARRRLQEDDFPFLLGNGYFERLHFESILRVYDMLEYPLDPKGSELYSQFKDRRMKPEFEWHPRRENAMPELK